MKRPPDDILPQELARLAVETYIRRATVIEPPLDPSNGLEIRAGTFVTLRDSDRRLRGCIGTIVPMHASVAEEIVKNAILAATSDPRFPPVFAKELRDLRYGVDILSSPEPARGPEDLDPSIYGVIIETLDGKRRGVLLPGIEGLESVEAQWKAVHLKSGITLGTPVRVKRFSVIRFGEH
jgi:AmmeMemoRadiSam system protein A